MTIQVFLLTSAVYGLCMGCFSVVMMTSEYFPTLPVHQEGQRQLIDSFTEILKGHF